MNDENVTFTINTDCSTYGSTITTGSTLTVGDTFIPCDYSTHWPDGWSDGWLHVDTDGYVHVHADIKEDEPQMHVYEVIAVNRRTRTIQRHEIVVAASRDNALMRASQGLADIDECHVDVRKLFSFEPIEERK